MCVFFVFFFYMDVALFYTEMTVPEESRLLLERESFFSKQRNDNKVFDAGL